MRFVDDTNSQPYRVCSHSHEVKRAVGDEEHLLSILRQLLQHSVALLTVADVLSCENPPKKTGK